VVLSLQLPFAVIPLVRFCTNRGLMGELRLPGWLQASSWLCAAAIVLINLSLLSTMLGSFSPWPWLPRMAGHG
jgi:manganese transport protein